MTRATITLYITVDSGGRWDVSSDRDTALEQHMDNSGIDGALAVHKLTLSVPCPQDIPATITMPDDATGEPVVIEE